MLRQNDCSTYNIFVSHARILVARCVNTLDKQLLLTKWSAIPAVDVADDMATLDGQGYCKLLRCAQSDTGGVLSLCSNVRP